MLEKIITLDKELFVFLNNLGSPMFDGLWLIITKQFNWTPFFLLILFLVYKKIGLKNFLIALLFIAALITFCDQSANFFKETIQRLRPCNDPQIKHLIRIVKHSDTFSFFSGHATNSMATTIFVYYILKKYYKQAHWLFLFPLIFAYSRIYLGLHFPLDILSGYTWGAAFGYLAYKIYQKIILKEKF